MSSIILISISVLNSSVGACVGLLPLLIPFVEMAVIP